MEHVLSTIGLFAQVAKPLNEEPQPLSELDHYLERATALSPLLPEAMWPLVWPLGLLASPYALSILSFKAIWIFNYWPLSQLPEHSPLLRMSNRWLVCDTETVVFHLLKSLLFTTALSLSFYQLYASFVSAKSDAATHAQDAILFTAPLVMVLPQRTSWLKMLPMMVQVGLRLNFKVLGVSSSEDQAIFLVMLMAVMLALTVLDGAFIFPRLRAAILDTQKEVHDERVRFRKQFKKSLISLIKAIVKPVSIDLNLEAPSDQELLKQLRNQHDLQAHQSEVCLITHKVPRQPVYIDVERESHAVYEYDALVKSWLEKCQIDDKTGQCMLDGVKSMKTQQPVEGWHQVKPATAAIATINAWIEAERAKRCVEESSLEATQAEGESTLRQRVSSVQPVL